MAFFVVRKYRYQLNDIICFYIMFICILFWREGMKKIDVDSLIGTTSNMLTLLKEGGGRSGKRTVICLCSCGKQVEITLSQWTDKRSVSCGCYQKEITRDRTKTHGLSNTAEYKVWQGMKGNPNHADYYNYGARGITVSDEWRNSFETFINDMGERPTATSTVERIDGTKGYSRDNCCWIEKSLQSGNRRKPCKKGTSVNYEIKRESYLKRKAA